MPVELKMLAWSIALGLVHVLVGAALTTHQRGLKWNVGARDAALPPLTGVASSKRTSTFMPSGKRSPLCSPTSACALSS